MAESESHHDFLLKQGLEFIAAKQWAEAEGSLRALLLGAPRHAEGWRGLGIVAANTDRLNDAVAHMTWAANIEPDHPAIAADLGLLLRSSGRHDLAETALKSAVSLGARSLDVMLALGALSLARGAAIDAVDWYKRAVEIDQSSFAAFTNLGVALIESGDPTTAAVILSRAIDLNSESAEARYNRGMAREAIGDFGGAVEDFSGAARIAPADGRFAQRVGSAALRLGRLAEGWANFERRFFDDGANARTFKKRYPTPPPYWEGESLTDKGILLWREQGVGDEILASGVVPDVLARAKSCVIICSRRMQSVLQRSFPSARIVPFGILEEFTSLGCDYQLPIGSLGRFFRTDFARFPRHSGYLKADPKKVARYRAHYQTLAAGKRIIGVSWRSAHEKLGVLKSAELSDWGAVLGASGAWFVNLQYGDCTAELAAVKTALGAEVYQDPTVDPLGDLDDFFAQVAALDLVISTSNTTVHVAGSQNVPTWVVLPRGGGSLWYWFLDRRDSPWYPSLKLYRQPLMGGSPWWRDVVAEVGRDLKAWIDHG